MRTKAEMDEAITYWKRVLTDGENDPRYSSVAGDPTPVIALVKGVVWALEWANGRDREEILNEAMKEEWIQRLMP